MQLSQKSSYAKTWNIIGKLFLQKPKYRKFKTSQKYFLAGTPSNMCLNIQSLIGTSSVKQMNCHASDPFHQFNHTKYFQLTIKFKPTQHSARSFIETFTMESTTWLNFSIKFSATVKQSTKVKISLDTICHYFKCQYMIKEIYMYISIFIRLMIGTTEVYMLVP